jgi:uncharacterized protein
VRVFFDTNVLVAAFVSRGACHELFEHVGRLHTIVSSERVLDELTRVLVDKFGVPGDRAAAAASLVRDSADVAVPDRPATGASRDPDDDWVRAAAAAGACDCIVTGDKDLLILGEYRDLPILKPVDFWRFEGDRL